MLQVAAGLDDTTWSLLAAARRQDQPRRWSAPDPGYGHAHGPYARALACLRDGARRCQGDARWELIRSLATTPAPWGYAHSAFVEAVAASALTTAVGQGKCPPFTQADQDIVLAPWRYVVEGDLRSRLALAMMPAWKLTGEQLWLAVDEVLHR